MRRTSFRVFHAHFHRNSIDFPPRWRVMDLRVKQTVPMCSAATLHSVERLSQASHLKEHSGASQSSFTSQGA
eukprot:3800678-Pleurochrysis_carterae.AAC.1